MEIIERVVKNNLIGFEVIKETDTGCLVENITEPSEEQFDNIFSKIILNIEHLFDVADDILQGEKREFENTERQIQAFDNFCRRVISKNNKKSMQLVWTFHSELIHAQRELYHMLVFLSKNKGKSDARILHLLDRSKKIFGLLKKAYYEKDMELLEQIHDLEKKVLYKEGYEELKKNSETIIVHHLLNSIRSFYLASSPLFGLLVTA